MAERFEAKAAMQLLLGPVLAIIEPAYYARVARASLGQGLLYILYLALLTAVGFGLALERWWLPEADGLATWVTLRLPAVTFTKDGVVSPVEQPFVLEHPTYGTLVRLDTTRDTPDLDQPALVTVTRRQIVLAKRQEGRPAEYRAWDVAPRSESERSSWTEQTFDGSSLLRLYWWLRPWAWTLVGVVILATFLWKVLAGLFYSLAALLVNVMLGAGFPYATLLTLTFFALTPATVLQWLAWVGLTGGAHPGLAGSWFLTVAYVFVAVRSAQRATAGEAPPVV